MSMFTKGLRVLQRVLVLYAHGVVPGYIVSIEKRGCLRVCLQHGGEGLYIVNVHGSLVSPVVSEAQQITGYWTY